MDGVIVSNHGGRQVDGAIGAIEALPDVVAAVDGRVPVIIDSGVRGGADAFMALALGATAVGIGRPYVYGLAIAGEEGVREVIQNFAADFDLTMGLAGRNSVAEIRRTRWSAGALADRRPGPCRRPRPPRPRRARPPRVRRPRGTRPCRGRGSVATGSPRISSQPSRSISNGFISIATAGNGQVAL